MLVILEMHRIWLNVGRIPRFMHAQRCVQVSEVNEGGKKMVVYMNAPSQYLREWGAWRGMEILPTMTYLLP
jgi:hypothetical protein